MAKTKVVLNNNGVRELLRSDWMMGNLQTQANKVAQLAGDGYLTSQYTGEKRANVSVYADTYDAYMDAMENDTLNKIIQQLRIN